MPGGRTTFQDSWLAEVDVNGDSPKLYVQKTGNYSFRCTFCCSGDLRIDNVGRAGIFQHAVGKKHKVIADVRAGRIKNQPFFNPGAQDQEEMNAENSDDPVNNDEEVEAGGDEDGEGVTASREPRRGITSYFTRVIGPTAATEPPAKMTLTDKVVRAEAKIALKAVDANWAYNTMDDFAEVMSDAFPDSPILQKYQMKSRKLSYVVSNGLGPYFHEVTVEDLKNAPSFCLGLDSATTKQQGLTNTLDFKVRFFSKRLKQVV
jgi:hypothetical protein